MAASCHRLPIVARDGGDTYLIPRMSVLSHVGTGSCMLTRRSVRPSRREMALPTHP